MNNNTGRNLVVESLVSMAFTQEIEHRTRVQISQLLLCLKRALVPSYTPNMVTVKKNYIRYSPRVR